jgi:glycerol-3-phosphate dehydrogenase (NAD(P)+)
VSGIAVVGAGAWGTAIAHVLAGNGHAVTLWAREPEVADGINRSHENERFLPGAALHPTLRATSDLAAAVDGEQMLVLAVPSAYLRTVIRLAAPHVREDALVVVATKGIEEATLALMTDVASDELPGRITVALSGPSFAAEVAAGQPTALVAASSNGSGATAVQEAMSNNRVRIYTHDDVTGVELGGALKNVMAVATGIVEGCGYGHNTRAALITRGLAEMSTRTSSPATSSRGSSPAHASRSRSGSWRSASA